MLLATRPLTFTIPILLLTGCFGPQTTVAATAVPIADVRGPISLPLSAEERQACPAVGSIDVYHAGALPQGPYERVAQLQAIGDLGIPPNQVGAWLRHRANDVCADAIVDTTIDPYRWTEDSVSFIGRAIAIRFTEAPTVHTPPTAAGWPTPESAAAVEASSRTDGRTDSLTAGQGRPDPEPAPPPTPVSPSPPQVPEALPEASGTPAAPARDRSTPRSHGSPPAR